jgi:hypothetical protein
MSPLRWRRAVRIALVLVATGMWVVGLSAVAAPAFAQSPWWHVSSVSRPSYLQPGKATDEVQEVRVSGETGLYTLAARPDSSTPEGKAILPADATPTEVQHELEGVLGEGAVSVTAGQPVPGGKSYKVAFVGGLEAQWIAMMDAGAVNANSPSVSVSEVTRGRPDGVIVVDATNLGDANANPAVQPITVADVLPHGAKVVAIEGVIDETLEIRQWEFASRVPCSRVTVSCTFTGTVPLGETRFPGEYPSSLVPYKAIEIRVEVKLAGVKAGAVNEASVTGGGAPSATVRRPLKLSSESMPFGVNTYEMRPEEEGGGVDTQAGSHPFQLTTTIDFNETLEARPPAMAKDLHFSLPPGLIGNPEPFPRCTLAEFYAKTCPPQTVVGVSKVLARGSLAGGQVHGGGGLVTAASATIPLFNLEPQAGEPARFGFMVEPFAEQIPVFLDTAVRTGGDYGVTVNVSNITEEAEFLASEVTFWGVPGDPRHDSARGKSCLFGSQLESERKEPDTGPCVPLGAHNPPPLLSLPTSCAGPMLTSVEADSWARPGVFGSFGSNEPLPALDSCNRLPFTPSIKVTPDGTAGSTPTGLNVDVHVPQELVLNPTGLAESSVKEITVALPEGVSIDPSGGDGLEACSEGLVGFGGFTEFASEPGVSLPTFSSTLPGSIGSSEPFEPGINFCANASKIGTVTIRTPLLPNLLTGAVYLAAQESNPFGSLIAMYVVAQDPVSGTVVKLPGVVHLTSSGQIVSTFENNPQLPFEDAELHFFGGERAPLSSPSRCGAYTTQASYTPWSGAGAVSASSTFDVTSGPHGGPCPGASLPFNPSLTGGTASIQAGGFSPFTMTMSREDGEQPLQAISLHMPPGLSGLLAGVELCQEPQADEGLCSPNSQIGETTVGVGVGGDPFTVTGGKVFITGPYKGAPFGLSIVNPAKAGPFDLEKTAANHPACDCLVVRAKIEVDPVTAQLTVTSDNEGPYKIPTSLEGIPLQIKHVNVTINRPEFTFNPTDCNPMRITGSLSSAEGATSALSVPFQATNCAVLAFKPGFSVSTSGKTSRANGASLHVKLTYPSGSLGKDANVAKVKVDLPKQLPSRLSTLQKACTDAQFEANPAGCPAESIVGHAKAITPLIPVPLEGPAYFVSHGGAKFPELIVVLQGYGVTLDLHGETFISKTGITSSTFTTVPDAPVGSFELTLPEGKYSALAANGNLCKSTLAMPTSFVAQNGAEIHESTPIGVTGCAPAVSVVRHSVKGADVTIAASVPSAGKLVASGAGPSRVVKHAGKAGTLSVSLKLSAHERALLKSHPGRKLQVAVKLLFTPAHGQKLTAGVNVNVG